MTKYNKGFLSAEDGYRIATRLYSPDDEIVGTVLIAPAMGVHQAFYQSLSTWLAGQGFQVATFDYRGIGDSKDGSLRGFEADLLLWASQDVAAAARWVQSLSAGKPLHWLGHSLGGQLMPLVPDTETFSQLITVVAGSGYWRDGPPKLANKTRFLWHALVPVVLPLWGFFPGKRIGIVGNLPRGVMAQWRRWCLNPDYLIGEVPEARSAYANVSIPVTGIYFSDDELLSSKNIESLHHFFTGTKVDMKRFSPEEFGSGPIGHFGFFKERFAESLWTKELLPLLQAPSCPSPTEL